MTGKMNWDRVRKENQSMRFGLDWIGSDAVGPRPGNTCKPSPKGKAAEKRQAQSRVRMPGCMCGKAIGFDGLHKQKCPLSSCNIPQSNLHADSPSNHKQFVECVRKAGKLPPVREFLTSLQDQVAAARNIAGEDRQGAEKLIRALLESLADAPVKVPEKEIRRNLSDEGALRAIIERRLDLYLRADAGVALAAVDSVAKDLDLPSYRFQCSSSIKEWELWGHCNKVGKHHPSLLCKAFATGGIFCIQHLERAPEEMQFWVKNCLDGTVWRGNINLKRHADFVLVLTSSVPIHQLWSGNVDRALFDRFSYLDKR